MFLLSLLCHLPQFSLWALSFVACKILTWLIFSLWCSCSVCRKTSASAFSFDTKHQQTKGIQRRGLDRIIQCRKRWVNAQDSPIALHMILQWGTISTYVQNAMHTCLNAQFYVTIPLFMSIAEELAVEALAPFAGAFLSHWYASIQRVTTLFKPGN